MNSFKKYIYKTSEAIILPCNESANSGGTGVTEYTLSLDNSLGGIIIIDFFTGEVPDKLEIIHNGVKKATTGMTVSNCCVFDNVYGDPTVPTTPQANATDQFIGTSKGIVPTRDSVFLSETGITGITSTKQQLVWWVYNSSNYNTSSSVIVRITGIVGTGWTIQRLCTSQTPIGI